MQLVLNIGQAAVAGGSICHSLVLGIINFDAGVCMFTLVGVFLGVKVVSIRFWALRGVLVYSVCAKLDSRIGSWIERLVFSSIF